MGSDSLKLNAPCLPWASAAQRARGRWPSAPGLLSNVVASSSLENVAAKASLIKAWKVKVARLPCSRSGVWATLSGLAGPSWVRRLLCSSTHERHAVYMRNLWKVVQTQHVPQGALLAAFWREALQMRGKGCAGPRPWGGAGAGEGGRGEGGERGRGRQVPLLTPR